MKKKQKQKTPFKALSTKPIFKPDKTNIFLKKYSSYLLNVLVGIIIFIVFHNFLIGKLYYLFKDIGSDSINLIYPGCISVSNYLKSEGFPLWSFAHGMGQEIMSFSMADPFFFVVLFLKSQFIAYGLIWIELVKLILTAFFIYHFLRLLNLSPLAVIIGVILYCFSGFMILGGQSYILSTEVCYLSILLLAFEKLYQKNSWYLFPLSVALITILRPFDLYFFGLFIFIYFIIRHFSNDAINWKKFYSVSFKMFVYILLGIAISTFLSASVLQLMIESTRVSGEASFFKVLVSKPVFFIENKLHYTTAILRFFSNDILGDGTNYHGWSNYYEAPLFYIGLLPLLLLPQFFVFADKKKKIAYFLFLLFYLLPVIFPYFRYAYWLFVGDYYRGFSFFVALSILFPSLMVLNDIDNRKNFNLPLLTITLFILLLLLFFPYNNVSQIVVNELQFKIFFFLILYTIIIALYRYENLRSSLKVVLILTVIVEISYFNYSSLSKRDVLSSDEMKEKKGYNDYSVEAIKYINEKDKQFFRVNKEYTSDYTIHMSLNDAQAQGYYGTMVYSSFNQKYYIRFLEEMQILKKGDPIQNKWIIGLIKRPFLLSIVSNKYNLTKQPESILNEIGYVPIGKFGDVNVLKNINFLPFGFTYDRYFLLSDFSKKDPVIKDLIMLNAFVAEDSSLAEFKKLKPFAIRENMIDYSIENYTDDIKSLKKDTLNITSFSQNKISGRIEIDTPKMLFFSIPYDRGWNAIVDGKNVKPMLCNIGFMGLFLQPGKHNIELYYKPPYFYFSLIVSISSIILYLALIASDLYFKNKKSKKI